MLEEQPLDPRLHDRDRFACGVQALDEYIRRFADQQRSRGIASVYVLVDSDHPALILGYYTLSAAQVEGARLAEAERRKLPRYPVPCFRMGRLACRTDQQGKGLGKLILGLAVSRCLAARKQVGAYALVVDAKDEAAKAFYLKYGFTAQIDSPMSLYLPLGARERSR